MNEDIFKEEPVSSSLAVAIKRNVGFLIHFYHLWLGHIRGPGRSIKGLIRFWRYLADWQRFNEQSEMPLSFADSQPQLFDRLEKTPFDAHYLYQSAWAARRILEAGPKDHVDVGSDLRFVALLSASLPTTFVDIRPPRIEGLSNLTCREGSILALPWKDDSVQSLSCLHVVEHIGLGRYGDPLDPAGSEKACKELARVLAPGGHLYFSVPVGRPRVCFNAHRIFDPPQVIEIFAGLALSEFSAVDDQGNLHGQIDPDRLAGAHYGCGLFRFTKGGLEKNE